MPPVISVHNLGKKYILSHQSQERYTALRDVMANGAKRFAHKLRHPFAIPKNDPTHEEFWALKDVSFDIQQGDRIGIIGRNGAGKSTLLKILSRITEPTVGQVRIKGRVASLLEVGTGFHPELTGRENVFLNGAILGMGKAEIKKKFDEIVAFAEVEKFLDTPVKRYSSGMYVRLAFAVAAHLEPEILIVDEVLAVGDVAFQKKCMGRMKDVGTESSTVIFVSHNMAAIQSLCTKAILLTKGTITGFGVAEEQVEAYLRESQQQAGVDTQSTVNTCSGIQIRRFEFVPNPIVSGKPATFLLELFSPNPIRVDAITILIYSVHRILVSVVDLRRLDSYRFDGVTTLTIKVEVKSLPLVEGEYIVGIYLNTESQQETIADVIKFEVLSKAKEGQIAPYSPSVRGLLELDVTFALDE
jgi:lipopolysaccharide transport system ATP-binding protein